MCDKWMNDHSPSTLASISQSFFLFLLLLPFSLFFSFSLGRKKKKGDFFLFHSLWFSYRFVIQSIRFFVSLFRKDWESKCATFPSITIQWEWWQLNRLTTSLTLSFFFSRFRFLRKSWDNDGNFLLLGVEAEREREEKEVKGVNDESRKDCILILLVCQSLSFDSCFDSILGFMTTRSIIFLSFFFVSFPLLSLPYFLIFFSPLFSLFSFSLTDPSTTVHP